jgi:hypothetical protein
MTNPFSPDYNPIRDMSREDYLDMMEYREYCKCDNCLVLVPKETLQADPVYNHQRICTTCLDAIREEISLNRKTINEL